MGLFVIMVALIIFFSGVNVVIATTRSENNYTVIIHDANYADLDEDGNEDDIWIYGETITHKSNKTISYTLNVKIETPDGTVYCQCFHMTTTEKSQSYYIYAYNIAYQEGWYSVTLTGIFLEGKIQYTTPPFIFDPPTGSGSGSPTMSLVLV